MTPYLMLDKVKASFIAVETKLQRAEAYDSVMPNLYATEEIAAMREELEDLRQVIDGLERQFTSVAS